MAAKKRHLKKGVFCEFQTGDLIQIGDDLKGKIYLLTKKKYERNSMRWEHFEASSVNASGRYYDNIIIDCYALSEAKKVNHKYKEKYWEIITKEVSNKI